MTYLNFVPVPADQNSVELYIAYLVDIKRFRYSTVRSYLNIVSVLHRQNNLSDPIGQCWTIKHMINGVKRELCTSQSCKAPVTPELLFLIHAKLYFSYRANVVFWAACLVRFFVS